MTMHAPSDAFVLAMATAARGASDDGAAPEAGDLARDLARDLAVSQDELLLALASLVRRGRAE